VRRVLPASQDMRWAIASYLHAKGEVMAAGYEHEIDWQDAVALGKVSEEEFLRESAWVILSAGMREAVVRGIFQRVSDVMGGFRSSEYIVSRLPECREELLAVFGNRKKIEAILSIAAYVEAYKIESVRDGIKREGAAFLLQFPFMGPATSAHLAKNLGVSLAKPDRHLVRIAKHFGCDSASSLCAEIAAICGEKESVVDLVFWRYATLKRNYLEIFSRSRECDAYT